MIAVVTTGESREEGGGFRERGRKERVLHTRISEQLAEDIRRVAEDRLRVAEVERPPQRQARKQPADSYPCDEPCARRRLLDARPPLKQQDRRSGGGRNARRHCAGRASSDDNHVESLHGI